ncbi:MAG: UbiX family flavin prenyltransferase [Chlamydiales bacterium]|nr:UbiX family flavin prenyltransferase [Chlamydiales bacterium]
MGKRIVVGISGATGIVLGVKTVHALLEAEYEIELVVSKGALYTAAHELGEDFATTRRFVERFGQGVTLHHQSDIGATICSGSHYTEGMVIIPCSMATVAAVAYGMGDNCLRRAADVTIKERRPLVIVPRETPFSTLHLENMLKLSQLGATIVPPVPAWYTNPESIGCVEDFIVGKVLECFKISHSFYPPYEGYAAR